MNSSKYRFLPLDQNGNLVNVANKNNIKAPWDKPIERLIETYRRHLGDNLRSLYIHGSVVRGTAVEYKSDIDICAIVKERHDDDQEWVRPELKAIRETYPFVPKIDFDMATEEELIENKLDLKTVIKTLSACVWGEDISSKIPNYKPNLELAQIKQRYVRTFFERGIKKITECPDEDLAGWCAWMMKRFVRTGFYICMPRLGQHVIDAPTQVAIFGDYYPKKLPLMQQAYSWMIEPTLDRETLLTFLDTFGEWLTIEAEQKLQLPFLLHTSR